MSLLSVRSLRVAFEGRDGPVPAVDGVDFASASLYATLRERAGIVSSRADVVLRAISADARTAALLGVARGAALLEVAETAFDQYDEPFETGGYDLRALAASAAAHVRALKAA